MKSGYRKLRNKFNHLFYNLYHYIGIRPKWESKLIQCDYQLQTYQKWKSSNKCSSTKCEELYHNRLNYLKGWL